MKLSRQLGAARVCLPPAEGEVAVQELCHGLAALLPVFLAHAIEGKLRCGVLEGVGRPLEKREMFTVTCYANHLVIPLL